MSYQEIEEGHKGNPTELYHFIFKGESFYYTSGSKSVEFSGVTYEPHSITRGNVVCGRSRTNGQFSLELEFNSPLAEPFIKGPPPGPISLTLFRFHRSDQTDVIVYWQGEFLGASIESECIRLEGFNCMGLLAREGLRGTFSTQCNNFLYGPTCGLNINDFTIETTVLSISTDGLSFEVAHGQTDGQYYNGGIISRGDGFCESREIRTQSGNTLTLGAPIRDFTVGETVRLAPGCDRYGTTCDTKFNNFENFRGFEAVPDRDPHVDFGKNNTASSSVSTGGTFFDLVGSR